MAASEVLAAAMPSGALRARRRAVTDAGAFSRVCADALPAVYSYLFNRCGRLHSVAEDLTQDTFLAAVAAVKAGEGAAISVPWLIGVARHKLLDHIRRRDREDQRRKALELKASIAGDNNDARERAFVALEGLVPNQRAAMMLHYLDGLPVDEVALALGKSVHATESLLARGRASFRRHYEKDTDD